MKSWKMFMMLIVVFAFLVSACAPAAAAPTEEAPAEEPTAEDAAPADENFGESFDANPDDLIHAMGTSEGVPDVALAAFARVGQPVDEATMQLALQCWREFVCDTGTGGDVTLAIADGWRVNVWRELNHMEAVLQALTYPEIGTIMYSDAGGTSEKAISDIRAFIAQGADIIIGFPDAGDALLPVIREASDAGIIYATYSYGAIGEPGVDYLTYVAEDVCLMGQTFAEILNREVGTGKVAFLGGTPGNPLSAYWQQCEEEALGPGIELVGRYDTNWNPPDVVTAMSAILAAHPDLAGVSYEYADAFTVGLQAYEAAGLPVNLVATMRTDEFSLFCAWKEMGNPNFKIFYSSAGSFQPRIAVTAAMMSLAGYDVPSSIIVPNEFRQVDETTCNPDVPGGYTLTSTVPLELALLMYP